MQTPFSVRPLGNTSITKLGFGGASMGNLYRPVSDACAAETLDAALHAGINLFDTSPYYGFGLSERRLGNALRGIEKGDYVLSTKVGRLLKPAPNSDTGQLRHGFQSPMPFEPEYDYSYDGIMRSYEASLQRLGLAKIDILLVHDIGALTHGDQDTYHFDQLATSGYEALNELRRSGDIAAVGLGVNECEVCERAMQVGQFDCFLLAGRYSLLEQQPLHSFLPKCQSHGASVILGGPYNSGILATGVHSGITPYFNYEPATQIVIERVAKIESICADYGVTLAAAALQFPLAHPAVASVIPGLGSKKRVQKTLALLREMIPTDFWRALKNANLLDQEAPIPAANVNAS